jgi:hypothetical protein
MFSLTRCDTLDPDEAGSSRCSRCPGRGHRVPIAPGTGTRCDGGAWARHTGAQTYRCSLPCSSLRPSSGTTHSAWRPGSSRRRPGLRDESLAALPHAYTACWPFCDVCTLVSATPDSVLPDSLRRVRYLDDARRHLLGQFTEAALARALRVLSSFSSLAPPRRRPALTRPPSDRQAEAGDSPAGSRLLRPRSSATTCTTPRATQRPADSPRSARPSGRMKSARHAPHDGRRPTSRYTPNPTHRRATFRSRAHRRTTFSPPNRPRHRLTDLLKRTCGQVLADVLPRSNVPRGVASRPRHRQRPRPNLHRP